MPIAHRPLPIARQVVMQLAGARERIYALTMTTSRIISAGSACAPRLWEHPLQTSPQELPTSMVPLARSRSRTGAVIPPPAGPSPPPLTAVPPLPSAPEMRVSASSPAITAAAKAGLATAKAKSWPKSEEAGATRAAAEPVMLSELAAEGSGGGGGGGGGGDGKSPPPLPAPSKPKRFGILRMLLKVRPGKKASDRPVAVAVDDRHSNRA